MASTNKVPAQPTSGKMAPQESRMIVKPTAKQDAPGTVATEYNSTRAGGVSMKK